MYISYWDGCDLNTDHQISCLTDKTEKLLTGKLLAQVKPELSTIEIETINRCNNDCSFCPANRGKDIRKLKKMDDALFEKIIDELSKMNYTGRVSLFSNDEPLLDDRIIKFVRYAREKLPKAFHSLYTNGILLDKYKYMELIHNLDYLRINNYNDDLVLNDNIKELASEEIDEENCLVEVEVRKKTQILQNRGGLSPNNSESMRFESPCILPFVQMVIRPDGSVSRCCQDVYGNETLGNVSKNSILEVFNGDKYTQYRNAMLKGERSSLGYCNSCDVKGLVNRYPGEWEYKYYHGMIDHLKSISNSGRNISICCSNNADRISSDLYMLGVKGIKLSYLKEDLNYFFDNGDFIVWGGDPEYINDVAQKYSRNVNDDFILYTRYASDYVRINGDSKRKANRSEIMEAEKEGRLVLFGAGYTSKRIVEALKLSDYLIVDNKKFGTYFAENVLIEKPDSIRNIDNPLILISVFNPSEVVKQLNDMGFGTLSMRYGYSFLR